MMGAYIRFLALAMAFYALPVLSQQDAGRRRAMRYPNIAVGNTRLAEDSSTVSGINVGLMNNTDTLRGVSVGVLTSAVRRDADGMSLGGLVTIVGGNAKGAQLAGAVNAAGGVVRGVQASLVTNISHNMHGMQLAGFVNICAAPFRGLQLCGITNIAMGIKQGTQVSLVSNICSSSMRGMQLGGYNYADTLSGSQIGLLNVCISHPRGVQIGIINYSRDTTARKIGLVNISPRTVMDVMVYGGTSSKINVGVRFRNRTTYRIIGMGTHYMGFDEDFSGCLFYRLGQYFRVAPRCTVSGDIGYFHIETFEKKSSSKPERLYSLQARVNADYDLTRNLGAFASVGFGSTRFYGSHHDYRTRMLVEAGLSLKIRNGE